MKMKIIIVLFAWLSMTITAILAFPSMTIWPILFITAVIVFAGTFFNFARGGDGL